MAPRSHSVPRWQQSIIDNCRHPDNRHPRLDFEERCIPEYFARAVSLYKDRLAIQTGSRAWSYTQLNELANGIAQCILQGPGNPADPVCFLLNQGALSIATMLGILKADRCFVPLDPTWPKARLSQILEDSGAQVVVTDSVGQSQAKALTRSGVTVSVVAKDMRVEENPVFGTDPGQAAWILFTSGSTGRPKGVVQSHRNVVHYVGIYAANLHICSEDRLTLLFSCGVNLGAHSIFAALLNGASLFPFRLKQEGIAPLSEWLKERQITIYCSVPTLFRELLRGSHNSCWESLRLVMLGGEPLCRDDVKRFQERFAPSCVLVNRLGSTETGSIRWNFVSAETPLEDSAVFPVGYPVVGEEVQIWNSSGHPVEVDQVGEIVVLSSYLSPGYWRQEERTAEVFSNLGAGVRSYRSGDLGRLAADGCLFFEGRKDSQLQIRGYRVEPAEAEIRLRELEGIAEATVNPWHDPSGEVRLVAYIVPEANVIWTVSRLREQLLKRLPDYLVPSYFVTLDRLPRAPNGKISRRELPPPDGCRPLLDVEFLAPRSAVEEQIAKLCRDVLGVTQVGVFDNFFELGGDSVRATQLLSRLRQHFDVELSLQEFFEEPTVEALARLI